MFIKDALDNPAHLGRAGSCLNLHEADACGFKGDTLDFITPVGSAVEVMPFALVLDDCDGPALLVSNEQVASLAVDRLVRFVGLPPQPHLLCLGSENLPKVDLGEHVERISAVWLGLLGNGHGSVEHPQLATPYHAPLVELHLVPEHGLQLLLQALIPSLLLALARGWRCCGDESGVLTPQSLHFSVGQGVRTGELMICRVRTPTF